MATNPPLVQFSNKSIYELYPLPTKIRQALVKTTKTPIQTITHPQLAEYILSKSRGYIVTASYHLLTKIYKMGKISLEHTALKRTICQVVRLDNRKHDLQFY